MIKKLPFIFNQAVFGTQVNINSIKSYLGILICVRLSVTERENDEKILETLAPGQCPIWFTIFVWNTLKIARFSDKNLSVWLLMTNSINIMLPKKWILMNFNNLEYQWIKSVLILIKSLMSWLDSKIFSLWVGLKILFVWEQKMYSKGVKMITLQFVVISISLKRVL